MVTLYKDHHIDVATVQKNKTWQYSVWRWPYRIPEQCVHDLRSH